MRRNKLFILGLFFAFVAVLSLTLVSGTWAKYTSNVTSAAATARVAKWSWQVQDLANPSTEVEFKLFDTVKDTAGANEEDVKSGKIIAPGTTGEATIKIKNLSEVSGKVIVKFTLTNNNAIPLKFKTLKTGGTETPVEWDESNTWTVTFDKLAVDSEEVSVVISWEWPFGSSDAIDDSTNVKDTDLGKAGTATLTVKADLTFIQVD